MSIPELKLPSGRWGFGSVRLPEPSFEGPDSPSEGGDPVSPRFMPTTEEERAYLAEAYELRIRLQQDIDS